MIDKPERFEPERAEELRTAVREAFEQDHKLRLADVVFERGPRGEVGVVIQTSTRSPDGGRTCCPLRRNRQGGTSRS